MMTCVYCCGKLIPFRSEPINSLPENDMFASELKSSLPLLTHSKCNSCGSIIATDLRMESEEQLLKIYSNIPNQYWGQYEPSDSDTFYHKLGQHLNPAKVIMNICDVGCGNGYFLNLLDDCWQKFGVEPGQINTNLLTSRKIEYFNGILEQSNFNKQSMDVITYFDVFEHLINPVKEIKIAKEFLSTNGKLIIFTGNASSITARLANRHWLYLKYIHHITIASEQAIVNALKSCGFSKIKVVKVNHPTSLNFIKWLAYLLANRIPFIKENLSVNRRYVPLLLDHMLIIASV